MNDLEQVEGIGPKTKELLEKLQDDMELRRIFKVQLLSQRKRNNRIF